MSAARGPRRRGRRVDATDRAAQVRAVPRTRVERAVEHLEDQVDFDGSHLLSSACHLHVSLGGLNFATGQVNIETRQVCRYAASVDGSAYPRQTGGTFLRGHVAT